MPSRRVVVVCGDGVAEPLLVADQLRRCAAPSLLGTNAPTTQSPSTKDDNDDAVVVLGWATAPATLVTDVHVAVCCFSPCHPLSFLSAVDQWAPLFAHLPNVLVVLAATRFELLASATCLNALAARELEPVDLEDVIGASNDLEILFNDADVTLAAVALTTSIEGWVGRGVAPSCPLPIHSSIRHLGRVVMAEAGSVSMEVAAQQWCDTVVQIDGDAEERGALAEWMHITHAATQGGHHGGVVAPPVYASRKTKQIALTMPAVLVHQTFIRDEDPTYEGRCNALKAHTPETYLLRKAMADADRRRAIDRSGKRDVVADPVLLMHERRGVLSHEVQALERKREKLQLLQKEHTGKREWLAAMQLQLEAAQSTIANEAAEEQAHHEAMAAVATDIGQREAAATELLAVQDAMAGGAMQDAVDALMQAYQAEWAANKAARAARDAVDRSTSEVVTRTKEAEGVLASLVADEATLRGRVDHHLAAMNASQDRELRLQAQIDVLALQVRSANAMQVTSTSSPRRIKGGSEHGVSLPQVVYASDGGVGDAALDVAAACQAAHLRLIAPLVLFADTIASPLEIASLAAAARRQRQMTDSEPREGVAHDGAVAMLLGLESSLRLHVQCAELQGRCTAWIDACAALDAAARRAIACVVTKAYMLS